MLYHAQQAIDQVLSNFPVKALASFMRWTIFPMGMTFRPPLDARNHECARLVLEPGAARDRLTPLVFVGTNDATAILEQALVATIACEPIDRKLREAVKSGKLEIKPGGDIAVAARGKDILTA